MLEFFIYIYNSQIRHFCFHQWINNGTDGWVQRWGYQDDILSGREKSIKYFLVSRFFVLWWLKVWTVEHQTEALGLEHQDNYSGAERGGNHNFIVVANALLFRASWFSACVPALLLPGRVLFCDPHCTVPPERSPRAATSEFSLPKNQDEDTLLQSVSQILHREEYEAFCKAFSYSIIKKRVLIR